MYGTPLQGWTQIALGIIGAFALAVAIIGTIAVRQNRRDRYVPRHDRATGPLPIVAAPEPVVTVEPYEHYTTLDIEDGTARLDVLEVELERIEWDGFVHDHDLDDFFGRVADVEAAARVYRDALLDHLIGAAL